MPPLKSAITNLKERAKHMATTQENRRTTEVRGGGGEVERPPHREDCDCERCCAWRAEREPHRLCLPPPHCGCHPHHECHHKHHECGCAGEQHAGGLTPWHVLIALPLWLALILAII